MYTKKKTKVDLLIEVLSDGEWHHSDELATKVSHRFGDAKHKAVKQGYPVERKDVGKDHWYRLPKNRTN